MLHLKPFHGRYVSKKEAKKVNTLLGSLTVPDRTELYKEARAYEAMVLKRRSSRAGGRV